MMMVVVRWMLLLLLLLLLLRRVLLLRRARGECRCEHVLDGTDWGKGDALSGHVERARINVNAIVC